jgi:hypothetical protein
MENSDTISLLLEHQFWLQILGDHARFIYYALAPNETGEISRIEIFLNAFDELLNMSRRNLTASEISDLNVRAHKNASDFRSYQLQLLALTLSAKLKINLSSTFINHMLNEIDEYILIMNTFANGKVPFFYPIHYHMLWLSDAVGHSAGVTAGMDETEKDFIDESSLYEKKFTDLYIKSLQLNGYMLTGLNIFPAIERFNKQAESTMICFKSFLENVRNMRLDGKLLGTISALMADHMAREECYYLMKLSLSVEDIEMPDCDPSKPRIES